MDGKDSNPKQAFADNKIPLHLWPTHVSALGALALLDGAGKYGRANWRAVGVRATTYIDALGRHVAAWAEGEDTDPQSGLPHLAHALACIAIIVDAQAAGKLTDDRAYPGGHRVAMDALTPHVARLKALHAAHEAPRHYDRRDTPVPVPDPVPEDKRLDGMLILCARSCLTRGMCARRGCARDRHDRAR